MQLNKYQQKLVIFIMWSIVFLLGLGALFGWLIAEC